MEVEEEIDHVAQREGRVELQFRGDLAEQVVVRDRVAEATRRHGAGEDAKELVHAWDPTEVAAAVVLLDAMDPVVHVPSPHQRERLGPVEQVAARSFDIESRQGVQDPIGEVDLHAPEGVHDGLEGVEVQLNEMVDGNAEVLLDQRNELARARGQRRVDLVEIVLAHVVEDEVARKREDRYSVRCRVRVEQHDHVAVDPGDTGGGARPAQSRSTCRMPLPACR